MRSDLNGIMLSILVYEDFFQGSKMKSGLISYLVFKNPFGRALKFHLKESLRSM